MPCNNPKFSIDAGSETIHIRAEELSFEMNPVDLFLGLSVKKNFPYHSYFHNCPVRLPENAPTSFPLPHQRLLHSCLRLRPNINFHKPSPRLLRSLRLRGNRALNNRPQYGIRLRRRGQNRVLRLFLLRQFCKVFEYDWEACVDGLC